MKLHAHVKVLTAVSLVSLSALVAQPAAHARGLTPGSGFSVSVEPIVGYEMTQLFAPTTRTVTRLIYGARATAGIPAVSLEAEFTHGATAETLPLSTVTDSADRLKLGLRSGYSLGSVASAHLRAGVQATQRRVDTTVAGITVTAIDPVTYAPYGGAGLRFGLGRNLSFSADIVAVFRDLNNLANTEYQTTAGFSMRFP